MLRPTGGIYRGATAYFDSSVLVSLGQVQLSPHLQSSPQLHLVLVSSGILVVVVCGFGLSRVDLVELR
jgi:hypothetical protein